MWNPTTQDTTNVKSGLAGHHEHIPPPHHQRNRKKNFRKSTTLFPKIHRLLYLTGPIYSNFSFFPTKNNKTSRQFTISDVDYSI